MNEPILLTGRCAASYVWNTCKASFVTRMAKSAHAFLMNIKVCFSEAQLYINRHATENTCARSILERTVNTLEAGKKRLQEARQELKEIREQRQAARAAHPEVSG